MDETRRPAEQQSDFWKARLQDKIARAADTLEAEAASLDGPVTIGQISVACALGFLDFRKVREGWREGRPKLAAWHAAFSRRPSMRSEEHTSELQSLMRTSYAVFCLKKKNTT